MLIALPLALTACASHYTPEAVSDPYGFFSGLWHGFVCPFAIVTNLVSWLLGVVGIDLLRSIEIIGRPNTGFGYYVGFFFGFLVWPGSAGS
jgi:hypothetical protein